MVTEGKSRGEITTPAGSTTEIVDAMMMVLEVHGSFSTTRKTELTYGPVYAAHNVSELFKTIRIDSGGVATIRRLIMNTFIS